MSAAEEERRYAPDGGYYSYQEFVDFYGGEIEWHNVAPAGSGTIPPGGYDDAGAGGSGPSNSGGGGEGDNGSGGHGNNGNDGNNRNSSSNGNTGDDNGGASNSDVNSDEEDEEDDYSDDSQYVPSDAPPEPEPEEIVDWFAELDEEEQDELTEWYDDFLDTFEVYLVLDEIAWEVAMYDPTKDPVWLDEQVALGFWPKQSITYKQKWALGDFFRAMGGAYVDEDGIELNLWKRFRGWTRFDSDPFLTSWFGVKIDDMTMQVKGLILSSNGLRGALPLTLRKLHGLTTLTLNRNGLEGEFPEAILGCPTLRSLDLHGN